GFKCVAIQIVDFAGTARMIAAPDKSTGPIAPFQGTVVLHRRRQPANIRSGLGGFRTAQKPVRELQGPVAVWLVTNARGSRIPRVRVKVIPVLIRLMPIENTSL